MTTLLVLALCLATALAGYPKYTDYYGPSVYGKSAPAPTYREGDLYGNQRGNDYGYKPSYRQEYPLYDGASNKYPANPYPQQNNYQQGGYYPQNNYYPQANYGRSEYPKAAYPQNNYPAANYYPKNDYNYPKQNYNPQASYPQPKYYPQANYPQAGYPQAGYPQPNYPKNDYAGGNYNQGYPGGRRGGYDNNNYNPAKTAYPAKDVYAPSKTNFYPPRLVYPIKDERLGKRPGSSSKSAFPSFKNFKIPGFAFGKRLFE